MYRKFRVLVLLHFTIATAALAEISQKRENDHFLRPSVFRDAGYNVLMRKGYLEKTKKTIIKKVGQVLVYGDERIKRDAPTHNIQQHGENSFETHNDIPGELETLNEELKQQGEGSFESHNDIPGKLETLKENGNNLSSKTMTEKELKDNNNDTSSLNTDSLSRNSINYNLNRSVVLNLNETGSSQLTLSNDVKTLNESSVNGLVNTNTGNKSKGTTQVARKTTTLINKGITLYEGKMTTKSLSGEEFIGNSKEIGNETNAKTGSDNVQQEPSSGNFNENVTELNTNNVSQTSNTTFARTKENIKPSIGINTNGNNTIGENGQRRTLNPIRTNFNSNNHEVTIRNNSIQNVTNTSKANTRNGGTPKPTYNTDIVITQGRNTAKTGKAISLSTNRQLKTVTLNIVSQTKRGNSLNKEQNLFQKSTTISVIPYSEQSVSPRQENPIPLQENISKGTSKTIKHLDTDTTGQPTTTSRTQTKDKRLHWQNSPKQDFGGNTRKETDGVVHATTQVMASRHTPTYDSSSVLAATLGGTFLGALLVFAMFYCKKRITRYIRGDYRRLPMEYDFELNPRLIS